MTQKSPSDTKIVVAMSGGVDSSVVAGLLHEQGYDVVGITLQLYDHGVALEKKGACCAGQDIYDAQMVAEKLGIPHYVLNYESIFKESVMEEFADSYIKGETPIPCVRCNQSVKFRDLFQVAKDLGADALATGHYVQRIDGENAVELHRGADHQKDQSYFLFATTPEQLNFLRFPLGGKTKEETRALAKRYGLNVAEKAESQDICFVPDGSYTRVIEKLRPGALEPGNIVDLEGNVVGEHNGIIHYTVGQRRGLGISSADPLYVIKLDADKNQVVVGPKEALATKLFSLKEMNWLHDQPLSEKGIKVKVKMRSIQQPVDATIFAAEGNGATIELDTPYEGISPGQACVAYDNDRVLGGGWIYKKEAA